MQYNKVSEAINLTSEWNESGVLVEEPSVTEVHEGLLDRGARRIKRAFDVISASVLMLLALPFAVAIAIAIVLETRGPVFFRQTRIGRGNRQFHLWKFRSMVMNGEEVLDGYLDAHPDLKREWNATHKLKDDPRVTRVGRLLRRRSLDELPQLWNVLQGSMSLIGPRPIVEEEVPKYGDKFDLYLKVKPGLTGLWQVSGRSDTSYRKRVELDCEYIRTWSLMGDLRIVVKTIGVILRAHGAY